jgi:hypothetical protein
MVARKGVGRAILVVWPKQWPFGGSDGGRVSVVRRLRREAAGALSDSCGKAPRSVRTLILPRLIAMDVSNAQIDCVPRSVVNFSALAPPRLRPRPPAITPQPRTPEPRWSRRHGENIVKQAKSLNDLVLPTSMPT